LFADKEGDPDRDLDLGELFLLRNGDPRPPFVGAVEERFNCLFLDDPPFETFSVEPFLVNDLFMLGEDGVSL
tara:strand:- start:158 stop:373 length:216 start_codon:yes stop_codon:yes gene_type:complete